MRGFTTIEKIIKGAKKRTILKFLAARKSNFEKKKLIENSFLGIKKFLELYFTRQGNSGGKENGGREEKKKALRAK